MTSKVYLPPTEEEYQKLLHDFQVKSLDIDLLSTELRNTQKEAQLASEKLTELYDFTPACYLTLARNGAIVELNLSSSQLMGRERTYLINHYFAYYVSEDTKPIFSEFLKSAFQSKSKTSYEVVLSTETGLKTVQLSGIPDANHEHCKVTIVDITQQKHAIKELQKSESELRGLYNSMTDGVVKFDLSGTITDANPAFLDMLGYNTIEIKKHTFQQLTPIQWHNFENDIIKKQIFLSGHSEEYEKEYIRKDGSIFPVSARVWMIRDHNEIPTGMWSIVRDISERSDAVSALSDSELKLKTIFELMPLGMSVLDQNNKLVYVNPALTRILGITEAELYNGTHLLRKYFRQDHSLMPKEEFASQIVRQETRVIQNIITGIEKEDGEIIWTNISAAAVNVGKWKTVIITADITEAKIASEALHLNEQKFRTYFELPITGRCITSPGKGWIEVNQALCEMLGYAKNELIQFTWADLTHPEDLAADVEQFTRVVACEIEGYSMDKRFIHKNGHLVYTHLAVQCLRNPDQSINYFVAIIIDISDRKKAEEELSRLNKELIELNAEKDKFFSIIAHDLRSPFNAFLGLFRHMEEELPSMQLDEIQKFTHELSKSAVNLYQLIDNLLDWSRMSRGLIEFKPIYFSLKPKLLERLETIMQAADKKEIIVEVNVQEDLIVFADEYMTTGILRNLLSNSIKFTPRGGRIIIRARSLTNKQLEISVKDTGIGMNKKIISNLFCFNELASRKGTDGELSTGLGLMICKDFVAKSGGSLWVESEESKGSTFYFTIAGNSVTA